jgi:ABC-type multidrug transport system ATPase subunit
VKVEADVRLDNYSVDPTSIKVRKSIAFVAQDDSLQITATPREAIKFSAKLRLPRATTDAAIDQLVDAMLSELGLESCADTIVGGPLIKGISGGERKRTSVGVELVVVSERGIFWWMSIVRHRNLCIYYLIMSFYLNRNQPWSF